MSSLDKVLQNQREKYREVFQYSVEQLQVRIDSIKPVDVSGDIFDEYSSNSSGKKWQIEVLKMLENDISKDIYMKFQEILAGRIDYSCCGCATCCNLACSEFSPEELKRRAENGDNFATQFLSVFVPYDTKEDARKIYPEYIALLEQNNENDVYFYHCPKLTKDNRCSDYENRPQICRDFPDNPLTILPKSCGFCEWKEKSEVMTLMLHAMIEIVEYYKSKIPV